VSTRRAAAQLALSAVGLAIALYGAAVGAGPAIILGAAIFYPALALAYTEPEPQPEKQPRLHIVAESGTIPSWPS